jgi:hypothetical protein
MTTILGIIVHALLFVAIAMLGFGQFGIALVLFVVSLIGIFAYEVLDAEHVDATYSGLS